MMSLPLWVMMAAGCVLETIDYDVDTDAGVTDTDADTDTDAVTDTDTDAAASDSGDTEDKELDTDEPPPVDTDVGPAIGCHPWDPAGDSVGWTRTYNVVAGSDSRTEVETGVGPSVSPYGTKGFEIQIDRLETNRAVDAKRWMSCDIGTPGAYELGWYQVENGGLGVGAVDVTFTPTVPRRYLPSDLESGAVGDWVTSQSAALESNASGTLGALYSGSDCLAITGDFINWGDDAPVTAGVFTFTEDVSRITEVVDTEPGSGCPGGGGGFSGLFQDLFSDVFSSLFVDLFGVETSGGATEAYRETWYVRGIGMVKQEVKDGDGNVLQTRTLQSCTDLPHASCP